MGAGARAGCLHPPRGRAGSPVRIEPSSTPRRRRGASTSYPGSIRSSSRRAGSGRSRAHRVPDRRGRSWSQPGAAAIPAGRRRGHGRRHAGWPDSPRRWLSCRNARCRIWIPVRGCCLISSDLGLDPCRVLTGRWPAPARPWGPARRGRPRARTTSSCTKLAVDRASSQRVASLRIRRLVPRFSVSISRTLARLIRSHAGRGSTN